MLHEILVDEADAFLRADDRLQRLPFRLELFLVIKFFAFGCLLKVRIAACTEAGVTTAGSRSRFARN